MTKFVREMVRRRAADRCEYCRVPQYAIPDVLLHIEHIVAIQHRGSDEPANLALACDRCNRFKGTNLSAIDPVTNTIVRLFDPRRDRWPEHFGQTNYEIIGLTETGRATVHLLNMNATTRVQLRVALRLDLTVE
ncbi:MAG: HNH endonuclease [Tepidisphaeraceae bacterium]